MARSAVPAYRLHKASGQARVIVQGKHHCLRPYGSDESKEKYARFIAEFRAGAAETPATLNAGGLLVVELVAAYWKQAEGQAAGGSGIVTPVKIDLRT